MATRIPARARISDVWPDHSTHRGRSAASTAATTDKGGTAVPTSTPATDHAAPPTATPMPTPGSMTRATGSPDRSLPRPKLREIRTRPPTYPAMDTPPFMRTRLRMRHSRNDSRGLERPLGGTIRVGDLWGGMFGRFMSGGRSFALGRRRMPPQVEGGSEETSAPRCVGCRTRGELPVGPAREGCPHFALPTPGIERMS